jgi:hypothetical protein
MKQLNVTAKFACALILTAAAVSGCQKKDAGTPPAPEVVAPATTPPANGGTAPAATPEGGNVNPPAAGSTPPADTPPPATPPAR